MAVQRIELLGVPVDVCSKQDLEEKILQLLEKKGPSQISFITIWDFMKIRRGKHKKCRLDSSYFKEHFVRGEIS